MKSMTSSATSGRLLLIVFAGTMIGCADDPLSLERGREQIAFTVSGSAFTAGDTIIATLVNRSDHTLGYNLCLAELDHQMASDWQGIPRHSAGFFCPLTFLPLGPGGSDTLMQPVREEFPAGFYRFQTEVSWPLEGDQRFLVTSGTFSIEQ